MIDRARDRDSTPGVTTEMIRAVRQNDCKFNGHSWQIIETYGVGPIAVVCNHCGADSGLVNARDAHPTNDAD